MEIKLVNVGWKRYVVAEVEKSGNYTPLTEPMSKPMAQEELDRILSKKDSYAQPN